MVNNQEQDVFLESVVKTMIEVVVMSFPGGAKDLEREVSFWTWFKSLDLRDVTEACGSIIEALSRNSKKHYVSVFMNYDFEALEGNGRTQVLLKSTVIDWLFQCYISSSRELGEVLKFDTVSFTELFATVWPDVLQGTEELNDFDLDRVRVIRLKQLLYQYAKKSFSSLRDEEKFVELLSSDEMLLLDAVRSLLVREHNKTTLVMDYHLTHLSFTNVRKELLPLGFSIRGQINMVGRYLKSVYTSLISHLTTNQQEDHSKAHVHMPLFSENSDRLLMDVSLPILVKRKLMQADITLVGHLEGLSRATIKERTGLTDEEVSLVEKAIIEHLESATGA